MAENDTTQTPPPPPKGMEALKAHVLANRLDVALWLTRVFTIIFCIGYLVPIFNNAHNAYYKALISNAATSALRLHQRFPRISSWQEVIVHILSEDSCHYLFYSMIFLYNTPIAIVIIPIGFFAVLHAASYSLPLLDTLGQNSCWFARLLISLVELQSRNILRVISLTEIMLMPFCVFMIFLGRVGLLTPFIYYNFLKMRYTSRRNPYTRNMFKELRQRVEGFAAKPSMPEVVKNVLLRGIDLTCRLAPPAQVVQE